MKKLCNHIYHIVFIISFFCIATFLLTYTFFFQNSIWISKTALLKSALVSILIGYFFFSILRKIENKISRQEKKRWSLYAIFICLILCSLILLSVDIPDDLLFAPQTTIAVKIPSIAENGNSTTLKYIYNGLSFVNFNSFTFNEGSKLSDDTIQLIPQEDSSASVSWSGRSWGRIEFGFSNYQINSQVLLCSNDNCDKYVFTDNEEGNLAVTSIEVPCFRFLSFLSHASTVISIFIFLYVILFSALCYIGNFIFEKEYVIFKWMLWVGLVFFILWLLNYAQNLLFNPNPSEYREGANLLMTQYFLEWKNPFSLENQPLLNTNKGFLYNLVMLPFAAFFGNTLFIHRLVSFIFNCLSCFLVFLVLRKSHIPTALALTGSSILGACLLFYVSPIARVDGLGTFLFLAATFLPWMNNFQKKSLFFSGLLGILAFYTKPYFLLSIGIVSTYLFLYQSKKDGFLYGFITMIVLFISAIFVRHIFECYFLNVVFNSSSNASASNSIDWMMYQVRQFITVFLPIIFMFFILYITKANKKKDEDHLNSNKSHKSFINFRNSLFMKQMNYFLFFFLISTIAIVTLLGENHGNYMIYLFQLMAPPLIIFIFQNLNSDYHMASISVPLILLNLFILCFEFLYPNNPKSYEAAWDKLNSYIEPSEQILNSPLLVSKMIEEGIPIVDSGSSEYFYNTQAYADNFFAPSYELVQQQGEKYLAEVQRNVENKYYDKIIITKDDSPFCNEKIIKVNYELINTINLYLPQSKQTWIVQIWIPDL